MSSTDVAMPCNCGPSERWHHLLTGRIVVRDEDGLWLVCGAYCRSCGDEWQTQSPVIAEVVRA